MTREQLAQLTTMEDLLQVKLTILQEFDKLANQLADLRQGLEGAGTIIPMKTHYSPKEFAQRLGIGSRTVVNWCHEGILQASQPGGLGCTWLIPASELERLEAERKPKLKRS